MCMYVCVCVSVFGVCVYKCICTEHLASNIMKKIQNGKQNLYNLQGYVVKFATI